MTTTAELERHQRAAQSARNVRDFYDRKVRRLEMELGDARENLASSEEKLREADVVVFSVTRSNLAGVRDGFCEDKSGEGSLSMEKTKPHSGKPRHSRKSPLFIADFD